MNQLKRNNYSPEVNDALYETPSWAKSWGIYSILGLLLMLLIASYFYKYPDVVNANVTITTDNPPVSMVAKMNGQVDRILVSNGQKVTKHEVLMLIDNPTAYEDLLTLQINLKNIDHALTHTQPIPELRQKNNPSLGALQEPYAAFLEDYNHYLTIAKSIHFDNRISSYKKQLRLHDEHLERISIQNTTLKKNLQLSLKQFKRDSALHAEKTISEADFESANKVYLQKLYEYQATETNLVALQIEVEELNDKILTLTQNQNETVEGVARLLQKKINILLSQISVWEDMYVIKSPIEGYVSLSKFHEAGLNTVAGETVVSIIPKDSTSLLVRADASVKNAGKVKKGQRVNIKLDSYPYLEYGVIKGHLFDVSKMSENKIYYLTIMLDNGLETTLKKKLPLSQRMSGTAEIITQDKRLIDRITDPITSLLAK